MNALRIAGVAARELLYERVFYIFLSFSLLSLGLSLMLGQMTYAEQAKLTLDFMLAGIQISMTLFSVFVGISLFQKELQTGSVSMVLSKPISRATFLLGKYLGQIIVQFAVILAMAVFTFFIVRGYGIFSAKSIFQAVFLISLEVTLLTAVTYFFAVNSGSMTTAIVTLCIFGLGHMRGNFSKFLGGAQMSIWNVAQGLIPDLEVFNMKPLASYGLTVGSHELGWAFGYAIICIIFFIAMAIICFNEKDILT
jgi:Cu-processing system permease protein